MAFDTLSSAHRLDIRPVKSGIMDAMKRLDAPQPRGLRLAYYPSAGTDTAPFSFLSERFLRGRAVPMEAPECYVYADFHGPWRRTGFAFEDGRTRITSEETTPDAGSKDSIVRTFRIRAESSEGKSWNVPVIAIKAKNHQVGRALTELGVRPYVVIGVTDGCAMGGNPWCVNDFTREAYDGGACGAAMPEWWVSDHLAKRGGSITRGERIHLDTQFGTVALEKSALLSTAWGRYGAWGLGGATAFRVLSHPFAGREPVP